MKLTEEQKQEFFDWYYAFDGGVIDGAVGALQNFIDKYFPQSTGEPNTTRWYHCSERLPTAEDADEMGNVHWLSDRKRPGWRKVSSIESKDDTWWSPVMKNLVRPAPPDPFEEFIKEYSKVNCATHNLTSREWLRKAYELGFSQPKQ